MPRDFMSIHQRPWAFDYYTSIYRSPIVSDSNMQSLLPSGVYDQFFNNATIRSDKYGNSQTDLNSVVGFTSDVNNNYSQSSVRRSISTASIRQMFANEKLAMITGRAKKTYDAQVLAHLGVNVPHDVKHDITMIHHDEYDLNVQEVTSLASTSDAPLGELAGKSYASGQGDSFKFTAPCHGVMMTIFSVEPKKKYFGTFDKQNSITNAFDIPTPEFDRLGNQPMFRFEAGMNNFNGARAASDIIGWKERYYSFKRRPDKVTFAFASDTDLSYEVNSYSSYMLATRPFAEWYSNSYNSQIPQPDQEGRFYIPRSAVDPMCMVMFSYGWKTDDSENWDYKPWMVYARDPFIIDSDIQCKKVSWMSKDGEPIYL